MSDEAAPRAYTADEVRKQFLDHVHVMVKYWASDDIKGGTVEERLDGLAFSILNIFDGTTVTLPGMDIVLAPHDDDEAYCKERGENWYEHGQIINDCQLHELYYQ